MSILGKPIAFSKNHDGKSALSIAKYFSYILLHQHHSEGRSVSLLSD